MNSDNSNKLGFQKKYIVGWLITGVVGAVVVVVGSVLTNPRELSELIPALLFTPFAMVIIGFGCFLIEGAFIEKFRFSEVKHPQWFWYVYPVSFIWMVCLAMILGIFIKLFTSKK
jgi:phosphatidylserine synthase